MAWLALGSLLLIAAALVGAWILLGNPFTGQDLEAPLTPPVSLMELATEYPELGGILADPKMDSAYKDCLVAYETGGEEAALDLARKRGLLNANGDLRLTLELNTSNTQALEAELEANWIEVTAVSGNEMDIAIPLERLEMVMAAGSVGEFLSRITNLDQVVRVRLPKVGIGDAGRLLTLQPPTLTPAVTPTDASASPLILGLPLQAANSRLMIVLGIVLCVVAPLLLGLGGYLLLSGLGVIRGRRPAEIAAAPAPAGITAPRSGRKPGVSAPAPAPAAPPPTGPWSAPAGMITPSPFSGQANKSGVEAQTADSRLPDANRRPGVSPPEAAGPSSRAWVCPVCGHENRLGARFCNGCGRALSGAQPAAPPSEAKASPESNAGSEAVPSTEAFASFDAAVAAGDTTPEAETPSPAAFDNEEHPAFCWNCGHKVRPTSKFCPNCGDRL
jgi:hypothetical protein